MSDVLDRLRAENGPRRPGRKRSARRSDYMERFGVSEKVMRGRLMDQLDICKDDSCRRLLLGIGEQFEEPQMFEPVGISPAVAERVRARAA